MSEKSEKRPTIYDNDVIAAAVESLWPDVAAWLGDDAPTEAVDVENCKTSLRRAMKYNHGDAYKIARDLDRDGWDVDAGLVDVLGSAAGALYDAEKAAVRAWVAAGGVTANLPTGTRVKHPHLRGHVGTIIDADQKYGNPRDLGRYLVFCAEAGHVREGNGTHGVYLDHEDVEVVSDETAPAAEAI